MAEAARDGNRVATILGVSNGDLTTPAKVAVDPATGRMLVTAVVTAGATTATEYTEGDVDASFTGIMLLGEAPGNVAKPFAVDASGNLLLTVTGVSQYDEGTVDTTITGTAILWEDTGDTVRTVSAAKPLPVDVKNTSIAVTNAGTFAVQETPQTSGGLSIFRSLDLDETEEEVKATAGQVYGMWVTNLATTTRFLKFYNDTAANVIVGTTVPVITWAIPGNSSDDISALFGSSHGIAFSAAITVAATTGIADADTGAPGANEVLVNIFYKQVL